VGNDHPEVATSLRTLAAVLRDQNHPVEAETALREALQIFRKRFGEESRDVAKCVSDLALALHDQGKLADAEAAQTNALAIQRRILGNENLAVAASLANLARLFLDEGKARDAERLLRECLATREKLSPEHWRTFDTLSLLGASLLAQKQYSNAEPFLVAGYEGMKQRETRIGYEGRLRLKKALQWLAQLYAETSPPERAAEWKQKLAELEKPKQN
jgi:serine/threonine-protein kinase